VVVCVKMRRSDLKSRAKGESYALPDVESANDEAGRQEHLGAPVVRSILKWV
jgi:hypothetical protein